MSRKRVLVIGAILIAAAIGGLLLTSRDTPTAVPASPVVDSATSVPAVPPSSSAATPSAPPVVVVEGTRKPSPSGTVTTRPPRQDTAPPHKSVVQPPATRPTLDPTASHPAPPTLPGDVPEIDDPADG
jgi:hypothetical protein